MYPVPLRLIIYFFVKTICQSYDTNLKVNPPLRTKKDRDALRKGIKKVQ